MPVINVSKGDLLNLVKINETELEEVLEMAKAPVDEKNGDEWKIEITADRPDMFSVEGIARAIKGYLGLETGLANYPVRKSDIKLIAKRVDSRPFIACAAIENVKLSDELVKSLMQMQEKLHTTIGRNRKKVAVGVHDLDKIEPPFTYKQVSPEEVSFVPLDMKEEMNLKQILEKHPKGRSYAFCLENYEKYPVIVDKNNNVLSFPPIINGELTRVTEKTKNLLIEVTGTDERTVEKTLNILACNIAERSGEIVSVMVDKKTYPDLSPAQRSLTVKEVDSLLGLDIDHNQIARILERMRYGVMKLKGKLDILIPAYRNDILHNVDLIEDVAIGYGYNNIVPILPRVATIGEIHPSEKLADITRDIMTGMGFQEVLTYILTSKENQFEKNCIEHEKIVEIENPVSNEMNVCRKWLIPNLLKFLSSNLHVEYPQKIFEVGDCIIFGESETGTVTVKKLAGAVSHDSANLTEIKSVLESVLHNLNYNYSLKPFEHKSFIESRCGEVIVDGKHIGFFGEIHPQVLENWKLERPVIAFEIYLK